MRDEAKPSELERFVGAGDTHEHHRVFDHFDPWRGTAEPGWDVNFLGVRTRVAYFSMFERLADFSSAREIQTSLSVRNEDYFEWVDLLESVVGSERCFRMIELGAGWGKWIANGARLLGRDYFVVGVEAEPTHFEWMRQHLRGNRVDLSKADLHRAAVAPADGHVLFQVGEPADWYGQAIEYQPQPSGSSASRWRQWLRRTGPTRERDVQRVRAVSLTTLLRGDEIFDLVDADLQAPRRTFSKQRPSAWRTWSDACTSASTARITRSAYAALFTNLGWTSLNDYPSGRVSETLYGSSPFEDGVQTWVNPRLS